MSYLKSLLRQEIPLDEHDQNDLREWLATLKDDVAIFGETPEDTRQIAAIQSKLDLCAVKNGDRT